MMSNIPKEAIEEFKQIYKSKYGEKLADSEAYCLAIKLLNLYKAVYGSTTLNDDLQVRKVKSA